MPDGYTFISQLLNYYLVLMQVDDLSRIFGIIFSITAFVAGIYAYHMKELGQQVNALLYAGRALGVTFVGDLLTLFIYWEIMSVRRKSLILVYRTMDDTVD